MITYTVRPVLWTHKANLQGNCPLKIAVTIGRKVSYFKTSFYLQPAQWDDQQKKIIGSANANLLNATLRKQMTDIEQNINARLLDGEELTVRDLKKNKRDVAFEKCAREIGNDQKEIKRVLAFYPRGLQISDIDVTFLRKYEAHERARDMAQNTINTTFKFLRRIMRQAHAEKLITENPFDKFKVPKYVQSERVYLFWRVKRRNWSSCSTRGRILATTKRYVIFCWAVILVCGIPTG